MLEILRDSDSAVSELIPEVGIESSHLSQQLGIMRRANLVQSRKEGATVVYSVTNPMIFELLDIAKKILDVVPGGNQGSSGRARIRRRRRLTPALWGRRTIFRVCSSESHARVAVAAALPATRHRVTIYSTATNLSHVEPHARR